jgi:hypothetical protein
MKAPHAIADKEAHWRRSRAMASHSCHGDGLLGRHG